MHTLKDTLFQGIRVLQAGQCSCNMTCCGEDNTNGRTNGHVRRLRNEIKDRRRFTFIYTNDLLTKDWIHHSHVMFPSQLEK